MKKIIIIILISFSYIKGFPIDKLKESRWSINPSGSISWNIDKNIPHKDHIEMSGEQISVVLRYGVNANGEFCLERSFIWPMLRTIPNNTHASLMRRFGWDIVRDMVTINGQRFSKEEVKSITLDGIMTVESDFGISKSEKIKLTRFLFPSTKKAAYCEKYVVQNTGQKQIMVEVPDAKSIITTDAEKGVYGEYKIEATVTGVIGKMLQPEDSIVFYADFKAYKENDLSEIVNIEDELLSRRILINELWSKAVLETPDNTINTMYAFAKIRGAESIYKTKNGYMHGPGGESYYAAIWANDQAEYINPFFPFLGYEIGNLSAYNSFKHFARFMNDEYKAIPSSIIAEGIDIWDGAGDRGDGAMIAYGVARYALAKGDRQEALELWPLLEWTLEYCRRKLNENGVVASDSDELENRFPSGKANLTTSSLYYDALLSAVYLGGDLGKPKSKLSNYKKQADTLRKNIERYFGDTIEGFDTYRYYEDNNILRSWICIPLTVGIYDRKDETIKALFSPRLWTENGLLTAAGSDTFWDRSTLYALRGVLAGGETEKGINYLSYYSKQRLLGEHVPYAIEAWPEGNQRHLSAESGLYCRIVTEGIFGIRPTGLSSFLLMPRLPKDWDRMSLKEIKAFNKSIDIEVKREGSNIKTVVYVDGKLYKSILEKEGKGINIQL